MKKHSFNFSKVVFHPSTLAILSGLFGAVIGFLINLVSGGNASNNIWISLVFAIMFSLGLTAWQASEQAKTDKQWMTMLQEMVFQTYFLTLLTEKPEVSQIAQQRLGQVLKSLDAEQQLSMLHFFSHNGLSVTFIGDALRGSKALVGADLRKMELPSVQLNDTDLRSVDLSGANLRDANLSGAALYRANLSGANLLRASMKDSDMRGIDLQGANLTEADLSGSALLADEETPHNANLTHAILTHAKLRGASLIGADLSGANLRSADLTKATFSGANLQGADLTDATLTEVTFIGANLQGANLTGATLTYALLDDADLRNTRVTDEQLQAISTGKNMKREG
ncbi:pentapeptide repeat-containing protein [Dictyobacter formicarum]|uniref:Pentapeptide repeat-containing protein n=1 Tax=Dictyobacter formicarum TaxID=2778368 RepID=A0ABQ3VNL7_9CHLR|nr:pentapeptide repeat-containing protein [Dictyobacter formicarum]GHO87390.1 hypothetical protein KSZ_53960 [Dictyobacter formicarum]